ncbi:hypothetical protein [Peribacillus sp. SI8-4]|uniref:hypothetical protein n=1 Tax=Peribacillus sp. SI8-4 TaxID=3048009 RepID=UPI002557A69F|nr:hypothetical protein [Peribacillus sp. SI8-4]
MMDYKQVIKKLEDENSRINTSEGQKEANEFRIKWIKELHEEKPPYTPSKFTDIVMERMFDRSYSCTPNRVLNS